MLSTSPSNLYGLVDMGSNGTRYSITDLSPPTARCLPTLYQDREGVSLYDAQYQSGQKGPIPQDTIDAALVALRRFQVVCSDFGVPDTNIRILATEATRSAVNGDDFVGQIERSTGWKVDVLPKEAEGRVGAMGVASSFSSVEGLVMDLGGGSTQLTWLLSRNGKVETSQAGSISLPYGAAALTQLLSTMSTEAERNSLASVMTSAFQKAYEDIKLPASLLHKASHGGLPLYLSGGGFRGCGYILMSSHKFSPYPIPIINGFSVGKQAFAQTALIAQTASHASKNESSIFRISKRRASQIPAVAFLVDCLMAAIPCINTIHFCQGGVREGFLYDALSTETRAQDPLCAATAPHGPPSADGIAQLLFTALPPDSQKLDRSHPKSLTKEFCRSVADLMYLHASNPKESRATAALFAPITGVLASAHGVSHTDRALLALVLCKRWGGDVAPPYEDLLRRLRGIVSSQEVWWASYLGVVAAMVGNVYPSGTVTGHERVKWSAKWSEGMGKRGLDQGVVLSLTCMDGDVMTGRETLNKAVEEVEKMGKRKSWDGGFGVRVRVDLEREERA